MDLEIAVSKTYSLTMQHIMKVSEMAYREEVSQGEILRRAIDLLYEQLDGKHQKNQEEEKIAGTA